MSFKLMTYLSIHYDVEDKAEMPLTMRRIGASLFALNRENVATNLSLGSWGNSIWTCPPHHPAHAYCTKTNTKTNTWQAHGAFSTRSCETLERTLVMKRWVRKPDNLVEY